MRHLSPRASLARRILYAGLVLALLSGRTTAQVDGRDRRVPEIHGAHARTAATILLLGAALLIRPRADPQEVA